LPTLAHPVITSNHTIRTAKPENPKHPLPWAYQMATSCNQPIKGATSTSHNYQQQHERHIFYQDSRTAHSFQLDNFVMLAARLHATTKEVVVTKDNTQLLIGQHDHATGLWRIPLQNERTYECNSAYQTCNSAYQTNKMPALIQFLHTAAFSPVPSTWIVAIQRGFFQSWPGLTTAAVRKHLPKSEAATKGHLDQTRKNVRSTKIKMEPGTKVHNGESCEYEEDPIQEPHYKETHYLFATVESSGKFYTYETGWFPTTSSQGNKYVLVLYEYNTNAILTEALKSRTATEMLHAHTKLCNYLKTRGFQPKIHWLDNEASAMLKQYNTENHIDYQLVPPHMHRRNAAERAIRTWKDHFVAGLCSADTPPYTYGIGC
jgi:hypothetical protein